MISSFHSFPKRLGFLTADTRILSRACKRPYTKTGNMQAKTYRFDNSTSPPPNSTSKHLSLCMQYNRHRTFNRLDYALRNLAFPNTTNQQMTVKLQSGCVASLGTPCPSAPHTRPAGLPNTFPRGPPQQGGHRLSLCRPARCRGGRRPSSAGRPPALPLPAG